MSQYKSFTAALLSTVILALPAAAATQGSLGATSTGSAIISVTKSKQAQITDIKDMTLANWNIGSGAVTLRSDVCVYSSTGSYTVTANGSGIANIYTIASGANLIPYSVTWNAGGSGSLADTGTGLLPNIPSTNFSNASTTSATCGGGANDTARVVVGITEVAMNTAASSSTAYTGTLTLVVTPY